MAGELGEVNGALQINSGDPELDRKIEEWLSLDKYSVTLTEVKNLVKGGEFDELRVKMMQPLSFGTAGLRSTMGAGFSKINDLTVIQATQGLCRYLETRFVDTKLRGVVVGFDSRHNSTRLAERTAAVFLSQGVPVYLFSSITPTPFVPYSVKKFGCVAGIMVTASHNPKDDNGYKCACGEFGVTVSLKKTNIMGQDVSSAPNSTVTAGAATQPRTDARHIFHCLPRQTDANKRHRSDKVYFDNGAQIRSPHDKGISKCIAENRIPWPDSWDLSIVTSSPLKRSPFDEVFSSYMEDIKKYSLYREENSQTKLRFTFTPMHGVGQKFVAAAFEAFNLPEFVSVPEQMEPDPEFRTVRYPNPEEGKSALDLAMQAADAHGCSVILANDPDSDRMAVAEKQPNGQWKVFTGNETGALFGWWAFTCHKKQHPEAYPGKSVYMIASTVSSKFLQTLATEEGFLFEETLTGFKWMGNCAWDKMQDGRTVLFAYEEAIGFMYGTNVLDKDGVSAAVVMAEMAAYLQRQGLTLTDKLNKLYERYGVHISNNSYYLCHDPPTIKKIFDRIRSLENGHYPTSVGSYKISGIRDLTVGYDSSRPDQIPVLPASKSSQMITFTFESGCVMTLRTSGTEPKIKYYSELKGKPGETVNMEAAYSLLKQIVDAVIEQFLQPDVNGLIAKED